MVPAAAILAACVSPPAPPAPQEFHAALTPQRAVAASGHVLVADGFDIQTSDAAAGIITAKRQRSPHGNDSLIVCKFKPGSIGSNAMTTTLSVSVSARPASDGSDVLISGRVHSSYGTTSGRMIGLEDSDADCASNGSEERRIAAALAATASP